MKREITPGIKVVEYPNYHRYQIDGKWAVGVTTALKGVPKEGIQYWSAREVAWWAAEHARQLATMVEQDGPGPAAAFMKEIPWQKRDDAAVRGTDVHDYAQQLMRGDEVDVPLHLEPYVEAFVSYLDDHEPQELHSELVVGSREHLVAGRLDSIAHLPAYGLSLVDYKTSNGVHGDYALQVAGYRFMEFYMDGAEERPMPKVDSCFILHLQPGAYDLIPVRADEDAFRGFLAALENYRRNVQSNKLDKFLGDPVLPPRREAAA